jgi:PncC family amidohydrolase
MSATHAAPGSTRPVERIEIDRAKMGADPSGLGRISPRDLAVRFGFGAAVSVVAGLVGLTLGQRAGGMLLAFPAVLPAALTLIESREGTSEAISDVRGAVVGAVGMVVFALTVLALAGRIHPSGALGVAVVAWTVTAIGLYFAARWLAVVLGEQHYLPDISVGEAEPVVTALRRAGLTAAIGESACGGVVAALLVAVPASREAVRGGVVAPTRDTLHELLDVSTELVERQGEVSEAVAIAMAEGARRRLGSDIGVAVAGPDDAGGGLTYIVTSGPRSLRVARMVGDRGLEANRGDAVRTALRLCREMAGSR